MKQLITRRYISVFDNKTELLVSDINISINADSKLKLLQTLFNERLENPMYDEYAINQSNFVKLFLANNLLIKWLKKLCRHTPGFFIRAIII